MIVAPPLRVQPERPLDEGTEWIAGRWTELVGLMYSADGGIADSRNRGLTESRTFTGSWNTLFFADTLQRVSPRIRQSAEYIRPNRWASILSYTECSYIHLLIYIRFASGAVKTVREHSMAPARPPRSPP